MTKILSLIPTYYNDFECIADKCEDTCCKGWGITVDKKTYLKYKNKPGEEGLFYSKNVTRIRSNVNDELNYGKLKLDKNGNCKFLTNENLCSIVQKNGPDDLCRTCKQYPRTFTYNIKEKIQEASLSISCPEAARKVLLSERITFETNYSDSYDRFMITVGSKNPLEFSFYSWDLRFLAIKIIQSNFYSTEQKITILGLLSNKLNELYTKNNIVDIPFVIEQFNAYCERKENVPVYSVPMEQTNYFNNTILNSKSSLRNEFLKSLLEIENNQERSKNNYVNFSKYMHENFLYVFENYLTNYVFSNNLFSGKNNPEDEFKKLSLHFSIIKYLLKVIFFKNQKVTEQEIVKVVYSIGREFEHDNHFVNKLIRELQKTNSWSLAHAIILVGN